MVTPVLDWLHGNFRWDLLESDWDWNLVVRGSSGVACEDVRDTIMGWYLRP